MTNTLAESIKYIQVKDILAFISTNSIEVDEFSPPELYGYSTSDGKNYVTNLPVPADDIQAIFIQRGKI